MTKILAGLVTIIAVVSIIGNVLLYERYSSQRPVVQVNGDVIRKKDIEDRLDYTQTSAVLRDMIMSKIVLQAAAKANCVPTDADVEAAKQDLVRATPQVVDAAYKTDPNLILFKQSLRTSLALRSLRIAGVKVSDADAKRFYDTHKNLFQLPEQASTEIVFAEDQVGAQQAQRMMLNGVAPNVIAAQSGVNVMGINASPSTALPPSVTEAVLRMHQGEVKTFPMGSNFIIIQVKKMASGGVPAFQAVKGRAELAAKLAKAPTEEAELAKLVGASQIKLESDKPAYAAAIPQVGTSVASNQ